MSTEKKLLIVTSLTTLVTTIFALVGVTFGYAAALTGNGRYGDAAGVSVIPVLAFGFVSAILWGIWADMKEERR